MSYSILKRVVRALLKIGLFVSAFLVIIAIAVIIYLSSPTLINKTLPVWLKVEATGNDGHPKYAGAISFETLIERYSFPTDSLTGIKEYAESEGIRLKHQGHILHRMVGKNIEGRDETDTADFEARFLGYKILVLKQYPDPSTDLIISEHPWFNYYLVVEIESD